MKSKTPKSDEQKKFIQRLESGEIADQACWSFIKELNSVSEERLDSVAITDGYREYTYRQMFREWERYAEAFSGLGLNAENKSRVALISVPLPQTFFALYGLNMTGATVSIIYHLDLYDEKQIYSMIEREKITDLVISEIFAFPNVMKRLLRDRELLGIKNIVVIPSPMGGDYAIPPFEIARRLNKEMFSEFKGGILMEDLLRKYEAYPITYPDKPSQIILHTTGTVSGMHKPVPLSNKAINSFVLSFLKAKDEFDDFKQMPEKISTFIPFYLNWAYFMVNSLHTSFSLGANVVSLPMASMNPRYSEAIQNFGVNVLFTSMTLFDTWHKTKPDIDLSKLKILVMGGTYVSPEYKKEFNDYLRSCGSSARVINGYGLSELAGACCICPSVRDDDAIGYLLPDFEAKIFVEDEKRYYDISDGPRTGVLLLRSPTMSYGKMDDGTEFFDLEEVDGKLYFNSHDLVKVAEDGCLTCVGRSNNYFVNNAGVRFDAGLVETAITKQPGIRFCGITPEFHKILHDNVPIIYVQMSEPGVGEVGTMRNALIQVFIKDELISDTNLPSQCVFVKTMPLNTGGKVDGKKLKSGTVTGVRYSIRPIYVDDKLIDILMLPAAEGEFATMGAGVPQELENDPYNIVSELFAAIPEIKEQGIPRILTVPGLRELILRLTDFDIKNIPQSLWNLSPKLFTMVYKSDLLPLLRDVMNMSDKKDKFEGFIPKFNGKMPPMPPMPPFLPPLPFGKWNKSEDEDKKEIDGKKINEKIDEFDDKTLNFWEQMIKMQKTSIESSRDQWQQFFDGFMKMQESFEGSLPEEVPVLPGMPAFPLTPKYMMDELKKFQKMSNEHFTEQADSIADFFVKSQEQTFDVGKKVSDKASDARKDFVKEKAEKKESAKKRGPKPKDASDSEESVKEEPAKKRKPRAKAEKAETDAEEPVKEEPVKKQRKKKAKAEEVVPEPTPEAEPEPAPAEEAPAYNF